MSENLPEDGAEVSPKPQSEASGGGGGRKIRTALGQGGGKDGGKDGGWYSPCEKPFDEGRNEPVKHGALKDAAIDALSNSDVRNWHDVYLRLLGRFPEFDTAQEALADVLAQMVVTAYSLALHIPGAYVLDELRCSCPYFSDSQLGRIMELASAEP